MKTQKQKQLGRPTWEEPRSKFSRGGAFVGFMLGLVFSAVILGGIFSLLFALGLSGVGLPFLMGAGAVLGLVVAVVLPFILGVWFGKIWGHHAQAEQRNEALGLEPPPSLWYGTNGRLNRAGFLAVELVVIGLLMAGFVANALTGILDLLPPIIGISGVGVPWEFMLIFGLTVSPIVRRLHDLGFSGWFAVIGLITFVSPIFGLLFWIVLFVVPGNKRDNKYGPQPQIVGVAAISPGSQK